MGSGSTLKFALCEVLQFAGLCVPLFIVMQRFAIIVAKVKASAQPPSDTISDVLTVCSHQLGSECSPDWNKTGWCETKQVQINNNMKHDTFTEIPVSLVFFSLICIDVVERIRNCRLTGQGERGIHPEINGAIPGINGTPGRPFIISSPELSSPSMSGPTYHLSPYTYTGPLRFLSISDARADVFVDSFMFWMDTVEMVRVAGHPLVYYSGWVFPIYIFSYVSCLRVVVMPNTPLLSSLGVALQDLPFFFVRVSLIALFGFVTPVLYLMKNLLVCLAFVYFNFMTKLRVFNTERMFF
uniref:Transmembrane protein 236 n=1 Tax=Xiphophorus couchianus TaxID=32473 RepID=A0A3B5LVT9_9TELE